MTSPPAQRPRLALTIGELELIFDGLVREGEAENIDAERLHQVVQLAARVRGTLERVRAQQRAAR